MASLFLYVAFYSYVIAPGQGIEVYQAHAEQAGPVLTIFVGVVIFFFIARWLARRSANPVGAALLFWAAWAVLDGAFILVATSGVEGGALPVWAIPASYLTKLAAAWFGARGVRAAA